MGERAAELLHFLAREDGASAAKACKRLALSMSELMRLLAALGPVETGGLGLVQARQSEGRTRLFLTDAGRVLCDASDHAEGRS